MIRSMTGYGRGEAAAGPLRATVEIRSVNHRFADLKIRVPPGLERLEPLLQERLRRAVRRGRVDVTVSVTRADEQACPFEINRPVVSSYLRAAAQLRGEYRLAGDVTVQAVLSLPDAIRMRGFAEGLSRPEQGALMAAFQAALRAHETMRAQEGGILARDIAHRVRTIRRLHDRIRKRAPGMTALHARRLRERIRALDGARGGPAPRLDASRLAQEVAMLADRSDITEELVRLRGYLEQVGGLLARAAEPVGKKLDFIMQEMNREANTINSKAIDLAICQDALEVKVEVEKIREQVQNIE